MISGLWAASATPVEPDGSVDHAALAAHARRLIQRGCDELVLFGTSGEGSSFSIAQRLAATEAVLRAGGGLLVVLMRTRTDPAMTVRETSFPA